MALPDRFSELRYDADGRGYVVDKDTGVMYYVRDEKVSRGRAAGATVRVYTPSRRYALPLVAPKRDEGVPASLMPVASQPVPLRAFPEPVDKVIPLWRDSDERRSLPGDPRQKKPAPIRARFIAGSEPSAGPA